jgi:hypothetical protein
MENEKWLKDWSDFDFSEIEKNLAEAEADGVKRDIGISKDEAMDFMRWLNLHNPELIFQVYCMQLFMEKGLSEEKALFLAEHIDDVVEMLNDDNC